MQNLLLVEQVDCRRIDDPDDSRVYTINKLAFPELKRLTAEHLAGGGTGKVNYVLPMLEALEPKMSVKGLDPGTIAALGFVPGTMDKWTFAGAVRNLKTNKVEPLRATIHGVIAGWAPTEHTPGELLDCDHVFHEVTYYELTVNNRQWFEWGVYPRIGRSFGRDWFAPYVNALGV